MELQDTSSRAEFSPCRVAADAGVDPHRMLGLAGLALSIDRLPGRAPAAVAVLLLDSLVVAYAATRLVALPPLEHTEPVDVLGPTTKLAEAAGLVLALRLFTHRGSRTCAAPP
jgi:hypothetical protein